MKPPYKTVQNRWYTGPLFYERQYFHTENKVQIPVVFALYDDRPGLINCRKTFVELNDPTGYKWAIEYLGDYDHWKYLMRTCKWFRDAVEVWLEELEIKIQSEAVSVLQDIAKSGSGQAVAAAKYLATHQYKPGKGRGRPSKEEVAGALKQAAEAKSVEDEDAERIGLKLVVNNV